MAEIEKQTSADRLHPDAARPSFPEEVKTFWQAMPGKRIFLPLLAGWLLLFHFLGSSTLGYVRSPSLFEWLYGLYNSPFHYDDHGMFIPFIVAGLFWWKRSELLRVEKRLWGPGLLLLAAGVLLHVVGFTIQQGRLSAAGLFLGIYGLMGMAWGPAFLRASFFPFVLFVFCVPLGTLSEKVAFPLRLLSTKLAVVLSHTVLGVGVVQDGTRIIEPGGRFEYEVAAACSGLRSMSAMVMLSVVFGALGFRTFWKRLAIFLLAFPLAVFSNVVRLMTIILAAQAFGQQAGLRVHDDGFLSLLPYLPALVVLALLSRWFGESDQPVRAAARPVGEAGQTPESAAGHPAVGPDRTRPVSGGSIRPKALLFGAALGLMVACAGLILKLRAAQHLGAPGVRFAATGGQLKGEVVLPEAVTGYVSKALPISEVELESLPADTSFGRRVYEAGDGFQALATVVLMGTDRTSIHQPELCLVGQGWNIERSELESIPIPRPQPYRLPVMKLTATKSVEVQGRVVPLRGIYVYWFVASDHLTARHGERMWRMAEGLIRTGVLQRWAYVTFFAVCPPGREEATFNRAQELIAATVPEFQLTTGSKTAPAPMPDE